MSVPLDPQAQGVENQDLTDVRPPWVNARDRGEYGVFVVREGKYNHVKLRSVSLSHLMFVLSSVSIGFVSFPEIAV